MQHILIDPRGAAATAVQGFIVPDDRRAIEMAVEEFIARLDDFDQPSDPDAPDFSIACDGLPGSPDDAEPDNDAMGDTAWVEWSTMRCSAKRGANFYVGHEDAEEDDPREANGDEQDENGDEKDANCSEEDFMHHGAAGVGCLLSDPGGGNIEDQPHDPEEDRCAAGDDGVFAGPVVNPHEALRWSSHNIGNEEDAESNGDIELNGDEGDYSYGLEY